MNYIATKFDQTCPGTSFVTGFTGSHTGNAIDTLSLACSDGSVLPAQGTKQAGSTAFTSPPCLTGLSGAEAVTPGNVSYNPATKDTTVLTSLIPTCNGQKGTAILNSTAADSTYLSRGCGGAGAINGLKVEDNKPMFTCVERTIPSAGSGSGSGSASGTGTGSGSRSGTGSAKVAATSDGQWMLASIPLVSSCSFVMLGLAILVFFLMRRKK